MPTEVSPRVFEPAQRQFDGNIKSARKWIKLAQNAVKNAFDEDVQKCLDDAISQLTMAKYAARRYWDRVPVQTKTDPYENQYGKPGDTHYPSE